MTITILTLFPESFDSYLRLPVPARAADKGAAEIRVVDLKDYSEGSFRHLDDSPFGGGAGMVMRCQPVLDALRAVGDGHVVALTPAGAPYTQKDAHRFAKLDHLILVCGHYEGMDERIFAHVDEEVSVGDYILTGGEVAAMNVVDSVIRLLPGVLRETSTEEESFEDGLLEYPQYTQPREYDGVSVPDVLLSGDHGQIARWRRKEALRRTRERRPDLWERYLAEGKLSEEDRELLKELDAEGKE
ncbi:MAG: tRNA (guanosine(37)-N1)-methyltransferase TrmD [Clostridia bacterium]|nr:tRNA (guanosine(37)-N1)-methyltransferase TrmD [Clostridia bacterium]